MMMLTPQQLEEYYPHGPAESKKIREFAEQRYLELIQSQDLLQNKSKFLDFMRQINDEVLQIPAKRPAIISNLTLIGPPSAPTATSSTLSEDLRIPSQSSLARLKKLRESFELPRDHFQTSPETINTQSRSVHFREHSAPVSFPVPVPFQAQTPSQSTYSPSQSPQRRTRYKTREASNSNHNQPTPANPSIISPAISDPPSDTRSLSLEAPTNTSTLNLAPDPTTSITIAHSSEEKDAEEEVETENIEEEEDYDENEEEEDHDEEDDVDVEDVISEEEEEVAAIAPPAPPLPDFGEVNRDVAIRADRNPIPSATLPAVERDSIIHSQSRSFVTAPSSEGVRDTEEAENLQPSNARYRGISRPLQAQHSEEEEVAREVRMREREMERASTANRPHFKNNYNDDYAVTSSSNKYPTWDYGGTSAWEQQSQFERLFNDEERRGRILAEINETMMPSRYSKYLSSNSNHNHKPDSASSMSPTIHIHNHLAPTPAPNAALPTTSASTQRSIHGGGGRELPSSSPYLSACNVGGGNPSSYGSYAASSSFPRLRYALGGFDAMSAEAVDLSGLSLQRIRELNGLD